MRRRGLTSQPRCRPSSYLFLLGLIHWKYDCICRYFDGLILGNTIVSTNTRYNRFQGQLLPGIEKILGVHDLTTGMEEVELDHLWVEGFGCAAFPSERRNIRLPCEGKIIKNRTFPSSGSISPISIRCWENGDELRGDGGCVVHQMTKYHSAII